MIDKTSQTFKDRVRPLLPELIEELNPPATQTQIDEVASLLPFPFPDELRQLYSVHNGEAKERGLFFGLPFMPLSLTLYLLQISAEEASEDSLDIDEAIVSVPPEHVKKNSTYKYYVPFAHDNGGNYVAVDLDPDKKGTKGQIINYGSDERTRYVIAPSLDDFLAFCIYQIDMGNYVVKDDEGERYFNLKEPDNDHFLDTLPKLDLPFRASNH